MDTSGDQKHQDLDCAKSADSPTKHVDADTKAMPLGELKQELLEIAVCLSCQAGKRCSEHCDTRQPKSKENNERQPSDTEENKENVEPLLSDTEECKENVESKPPGTEECKKENVERQAQPLAERTTYEMGHRETERNSSDYSDSDDGVPCRETLVSTYYEDGAGNIYTSPTTLQLYSTSEPSLTSIGDGMQRLAGPTVPMTRSISDQSAYQ